MKFKYLILLLFSASGTVLHAQNDPNAKKVLDQVSAKLKSLKGMTSSFSYITKDRKNAVKGSVKGIISIKGNKYYVKQGTTEIFCNGTTIWNYNGEQEVTVTQVDGEDDKMLSPQKLLSDFYDKDFTYKLVSSAGSFYEIEMTPTDKRKNFKQVNIFIDKAKLLTTKAKVIDKNDNIIEFTLSNVNSNATIPDTRFVFDTKKYPGVEVINQ